MLVPPGGRLLKKGEKYPRYRYLSLHLLAMCVQKCMKERREVRGGREGTKKAGRERERENNNDSLTTRACEKTAAGKSVSDHLPAGMHDFVSLKAAALQKGSCLVSTATKAQLRLYLRAWNVPVCTGAAPEQLTLSSIKGGNMALTSARPHPQIERQRIVATTELTSTSHYLTTEVSEQRAALCLTASE